MQWSETRTRFKTLAQILVNGRVVAVLDIGRITGMVPYESYTRVVFEGGGEVTVEAPIAALYDAIKKSSHEDEGDSSKSGEPT
jgi:hypothetical protein